MKSFGYGRIQTDFFFWNFLKKAIFREDVFEGILITVSMKTN